MMESSACGVLNFLATNVVQRLTKIDISKLKRKLLTNNVFNYLKIFAKIILYKLALHYLSYTSRPAGYNLARI